MSSGKGMASTSSCGLGQDAFRVPIVSDQKVGCVGAVADAVMSAVLLEIERLFA